MRQEVEIARQTQIHREHRSSLLLGRQSKKWWPSSTLSLYRIHGTMERDDVCISRDTINGLLGPRVQVLSKSPLTMSSTSNPCCRQSYKPGERYTGHM